jgi:WD40 repeat protein
MYPIKIKAHDRNINIVRFNYDGDLFFSGEADRLINVFEAYTGELLGSYTTKVAVKSLDVDL